MFPVYMEKKKRERELWFERKIIRSSRTVQEVLEEESIPSSKSVSEGSEAEGPDFGGRPMAATSYSQAIDRSYHGAAEPDLGQTLGQL